jgi:heavy metal sensor kinase
MASRLPIRWRMTLWYTAVVAVALTLFATGLYIGLRRDLYSSLDDTLHSQAALTLSSLDLRQGTPTLGSASLNNPLAGEQFVRLYDRSGTVVADSSDGFTSPPRDPAGLAAALNGQTVLHWIHVDRRRMRVLSQPVLSNGEAVGAVQVGLVDSDVTEALGVTLGLMAVLGPLILILVSVGGVWVARRALAPVVRMADVAAEIEAQDLSRRIDPGIPDDEVGRLARTFNAMLDRLETAFRRQRQFTADASHELRTPLTLLRSQIETALAQPRGVDADQQMLELLAQDVERLSRIASTLLALARSDAGEISLSRDEIDLPDLLDVVVEQYRPLAAEAGVTLMVDAEPVPLIADEDRLVQLLVNLVDNALQHTSAGGQITLACRDDGAAACLWVTDTGVGIDPAHLPHVFERFYRADPARGREHGGVGLGLNICQMIVEAHHGTIELKSVAGQGTTVTVKLPH